MNIEYGFDVYNEHGVWQLAIRDSGRLRITYLQEVDNYSKSNLNHDLRNRGNILEA